MADAPPSVTGAAGDSAVAGLWAAGQQSIRSFGRFVGRLPVSGLLGGGFILLLTSLVLFPFVIAPYDPYLPDTPGRLSPPSWTHLFGTDQLGRDIFSRIVWGARASLGTSLAVTIIGTIGATLLGCTSAYFGGLIDLIVQRLVDAWMAFPGFILLIALFSLLGPSITNMIVILSLGAGVGTSRMIRSSVLSIKEATYVEAARVIGASHPRIMLRHIVPQVVPLVLILSSLQLSGILLTLAGLGFIGFGIPPPVPEWGSMLSGRARDFMYSAWWLAFFPGLAITLSVLSLNLFFDSVRDLIDPRMRGAGRM